MRYQVCLSTIYGCGLRLQEGIHLQVVDIDSQRMVVHVQRGKWSNLGFVGSAQMDAEMARFIASALDWDLAVLEMGVNIIGAWPARRRLWQFWPEPSKCIEG